MTVPHHLNTRVTGRRVVATFLDGLVLGVLAGLLNTISGNRLYGPNDDIDLTTLSTGGSLRLLALALLYYVGLEATVGRTIGKLITGIRVVGETGGSPGFVSALVRTLLRLIDGIFGYLVGFLIVINSSRRRRLGDMAAKTFVVRA